MPWRNVLDSSSEGEAAPAAGAAAEVEAGPALAPSASSGWSGVLAETESSGEEVNTVVMREAFNDLVQSKAKKQTG